LHWLNGAYRRARLKAAQEGRTFPPYELAFQRFKKGLYEAPPAAAML
jgi:hypothetical protein